MEEPDPATPDETKTSAPAEVYTHRPSRWFWSILWTVALVVMLALALWPAPRDDTAAQVATWGLWLGVVVVAWRLVLSVVRAVRTGAPRGTQPH